MSKSETIGSKIDYLRPGTLKSESVLNWPPDVFCLCAAILQISGAYARVIEDLRPYLDGTTSHQRAISLRKIGARWKQTVSKRRPPPREIRAWWKAVLDHRTLPFHELSSVAATTCFSALLNLLGASDEACAGIGIYKIDPQFRSKGGLDNFVFQAEGTLVESLALGDQGATLCRDIHPSRARVLPKMHTPQNGLTIRSLSHHLAYCSGSDMQPNWVSLATPQKSHSLNLLLIPWPHIVEPVQFVATTKRRVADYVPNGAYGLFTFAPTPAPAPSEVTAILSEAIRQIGHIDGIVFPELSMTAEEFDPISDVVVTKERFLVAGVGRSATDVAGSNEAYIDVADPNLNDRGEPVRYRFKQRKHHRWKLTKSQIVQYGIGTTLHPEANWWEHISLGHREISFVTLRPWLTMSVLICEDLARPDPVGEVVRAVGPNLIIALLSDGPQLNSRWPSRYAGVLADDPGSSVLTVTSAGMAKLSKSGDPAKDRPDVIAFWRDAKTGSTEIVCPKDATAVVLNITAEYHEEWTADGRGDGINSGYPVLSGYHLIKRPDPAEGVSKHDYNYIPRSSDSLSSVQATSPGPEEGTHHETRSGSATHRRRPQ